MQTLNKKETEFESQCDPLYPMKVLHASQSILEKLEQTQGHTQVLISHPAASVASAMQAIQSAGTSIVSIQAGVDHFYVDIQYIVCVYLFRQQT